MNKYEFVQDARRLYIFENKTLTEISSLLGISINTLSRWKRIFDWDTDKKKYNKKAKNVLDILEGKITELLEELEGKSVLEIEEEELKKLKILKETLAAIRKTEITLTNYIKAMSDFADFISLKYPQKKEEFAIIIQEFFNNLENK